MGLSAFGIIVFLTGLMVLNAPYRWTVYGMAAFALFASASALTLPGNIGILPANLFLVFFVLRAFNLGGGNALNNVLSVGKPGFWMLCTCIWVVFGAIALPRLFAGSTMVFSIDRNAIDPNNADGLTPLGPVSGNLSQAIYCIGDLMTYACMSVFLGCRGGYRALAGAIMIVGGLNVFAGVLDIVSHAAGVDILSAVKTQYANLGGWELGGLVRVSGTFSETAAFSFFTMQPFAFCVNLWLLGYRPKTAGAIAIGSGLLLLLSTSGSAYVGLGAYLMVLLLSQPQRISPVAGARKLRMWAIMLSVGTLAALYITLFMPGVVKALSDFVEITILSKADSQSGVERSGANTQAMTNFIDTYGLGVGVGSARTSSFIMVLLACLGVVGTTFYVLFLAKCTLAPIQRQHPQADRVVAYAARHGMFAALIVASVNAPTFFLGPCFYMFAAAAGGLTRPLHARLPVTRRRLAPDGEARVPRPASTRRGFASR